MDGRVEPGRRRRWRVASLFVSALIAAGCGRNDEGASPPVDAPAAEVAAASEAPSDTAETARRFLPDEMRRDTRAETFPHAAHAEIDCAVCHQLPQGHGSHGGVGCAACHRASASTTIRALSPADCQACHHSPQQALDCERCHTSPGVEQNVQQLSLAASSPPRTRTLTFDHARHADVACVQCHQASPGMEPEGCASCHESHHVATARCQSCHTEPPAGAHDVQAHLTCSGSACHRAPDVEAISDARAVCLVCHQAQEAHEPGARCVECHAVRPAGRPGSDS